MLKLDMSLKRKIVILCIVLGTIVLGMGIWFCINKIDEEVVVSYEPASPTPTVSVIIPTPVPAMPSKKVEIQAQEESSANEKTISIQAVQPQAKIKPIAPQKPKPQGVVTNKAVTPTYKVQDVKPTQNKPKMGDKNDAGEIYVEGFGWIKDCGGGAGTVVNDMKENGNKIGIMN